jgi:hypothetical protein
METDIFGLSGLWKEVEVLALLIFWEATCPPWAVDHT